MGWLRDGPTDEPPALLLHGGPGLSEYLGSLGDELDRLVATARYQQRGVAPSVTDGERTIESHVRDAVAVLDALGWEQALIVGHSWGGHLAMHFALAHPERTVVAVAIDPLGGVGDGGQKKFAENLMAGLTPSERARMDELQALEDPSETEQNESFRMIWPYYFANPHSAPPFPDFHRDPRAGETWASIHAHLAAGTLEKALPQLRVPFVTIHGQKSPIPIAASEETVALVPGGRLISVANSGHWPWLEQPGSVRTAIEQFLSE